MPGGHKQQRIQISPVQVLASALASLSGAVVASFFGVAGTIIGAAVVSMVATIAAALYAYSLRSTHFWVRRQLDPTRKEERYTPRHSASKGPANGKGTSAPTLKLSLPEALRRLPPRRVAVAAVIAFVAAIGSVTLIELGANAPVSSLIGGGPSGGTSVGSVFGGGSSSNDHSSPNVPATSTTLPAEQSPATTGTTSPPPSATTSTTGPSTSTTRPSTSTSTTVAGTNSRSAPGSAATTPSQ